MWTPGGMPPVIRTARAVRRGERFRTEAVVFGCRVVRPGAEHGAGREFAVGALLLIVISLYNVFHKLWSGSIVLMGLCRGVWVLAAGLAFARSGGESVPPPALLWYAFGLFCLPA